MQQRPPGTEAPAHSTGSELLAQLAASRAPGTAHEQPHLAGFLQQQQQGHLMNLGDAAAQAHLFQLLAQLQGAPGAWGPPAPSQAGSQSLDHLLAQISRQPELAASLPSLLATLTGGLGMAPPGPQPSPPREEKPLIAREEAEAGPSSYAMHLYGGGGSSGGASGPAAAAEPEPEEPAGMEQEPGPVRANSAKCAKEKNRQAQRRFRERQKTLITSLKDAADRLGKQVEEQRRQIEALEKENQVLKVILQEKNKP